MYAIIITVICCVTIVICRCIEKNAHIRGMEIEKELYTENIAEKKPQSPYRLQRDMHNESRTWGYCITQDDRRLTSSSGHYQIIHNIDEAKELIWELEDLGGYERTRF